MDFEPDLRNPVFCLRKALEYSDKIATTTNTDLKEAYAALAREYIRRSKMLSAPIDTAEEDKENGNGQIDAA